MTLWTPKSNNIKKGLKILPAPNSIECDIICGYCEWHETLNKDQIYMNKHWRCWSCGRNFVINEIPDDIKYFLQSKTEKDIDIRPRIKKW